ncbi:MAG: hypothetical protein FE78DRAFT_71877 [Acidomyces sp. 'richmondensis']|nr:MAG: hypothetical protein FE78DRAFT_71877 [Acidomyces sp. 'richmondensis']
MELTSHVQRRTSSTGLSYLECGSTDLPVGLVCIPGWGCRADDYQYVLDQISKHSPPLCHAISVDLPGYGQSPTTVCPDPSISAFATAVLSLCIEINLRSVVLAGHSMGCRVALDISVQAIHDGKLAIKGLVFLDGSHYKFRPSLFAFDDNDVRSKKMTDEEKLEKRCEAFRRMFSARTPLEFQTSALAHIEGLDKKYDALVRKSHLDYDFERMDEDLDTFGRSGTPFMNLQSTDVDPQNQRVPLKQGQKNQWMHFIQQKVSQARQYVIEDSSHFPHVDQSEAVVEKLLIFMPSE